MTNTAKISSNELLAIFGNDNCFFSYEFEATSVGIDTRTLQPNSIFIAIKGEQHDSHNYIEEAIQKGAICFVVDEYWFEINREKYSNLNMIISKNTINSLGKLANFHRSRYDIDIIAVAGSNGKTTTKELIADVLSAEYKVLRTYKNYNNQIGVPLMLFQLDKTYDKAVIEIGTNEPGEIYLLSEILSPTAGVITNIGKEHLEGFGDLDGVEAEETSLFAYLKKSSSLAFLNFDDERLKKYFPLLDHVFTYGQNNSKEFNLNAKVKVNPDLTTTISFDNQIESFEVNLKAKGLNYAYNSIPAVAVGLFYKIPINKIINVLENYEPDNTQDYGRMVISKINGVTILNDTYNANPNSTELAIETLSLIQSNNKIAVLGDMLELGEAAVDEHLNIIYKATDVANQVLLFGSIYKKATELVDRNYEKCNKINHFDTKEDLSEFLLNLVADNTTILVKGSRGMKMEEVVQFLLSKFKF